MTNKTNLLEDYANFVDSTKKQNTYLTRIIFFYGYYIFVFIFCFSNIIQSSICTIIIKNIPFIHF